MQSYTQADLNRLFHLPKSLIRVLGTAGYITPSAPRGRTPYTFQDLLVLRMAGALRAAKIPSARIVDALGRIRSALPPGQLLTAMALAASGKAVAVREGSVEWEAASGQYALPLGARKAGRVAGVPVMRGKAPAEAADAAAAHYARGHRLENSDPAAARAAYRAALNARADHLEARINLGRLLQLGGELKEAETLYRQAKSSSALLSFNLAILLEDLAREAEAVAKYREALALDPLLHDAHFNLSRLHERASQPREALRHLLAYRRHIAKYGE